MLVQKGRRANADEGWRGGEAQWTNIGVDVEIAIYAY